MTVFGRTGQSSVLISVLGPEEGFAIPLSLTEEIFAFSMGLKNWRPRQAMFMSVALRLLLPEAPPNFL